MQGQWQLHIAEEWLTENLHRNYPLADDMIVSATNGDLLPSTLLVDLQINCLPMPESDASARFFISRVTNANGYIRIYISYRPVSGDAILCATTADIPTTLDSGDTVESRTFAISAVSGLEYGSLKYVTGRLIIGTCKDVTSPSYAFEYANSRLLPTTVNISGSGVNCIIADDKTLTGDVVLQAGDGIGINVTSAVEQGAVVYTIHVYREQTEDELSSPYRTVDTLSAAILAKLGNPIRSFNGVPPDDNGNIDIIGDDCTKITAKEHQVSITNPCAVPCCPTYETNDITAAVEKLEDAKDRMLKYYAALTDNVNTLQLKLAELMHSN